MHITYIIYIYICQYVWLKLLWWHRWALRVLYHLASVSFHGGPCDPYMETARYRPYQCCQAHGCRNWIWCDRVQQGFSCRQCGNEWPKPPGGYAKKLDKRNSRWERAPHRRPSPPPGLARTRFPKPSLIQKNATELLAPIWSTLDEQLRGKLSDLGISPEVKPKEPDLQDVLKENLTKLPTPVRELVEKITTPPPASEREVAGRLKQQVTALKDLSHKKHNLQGCEIGSSPSPDLVCRGFPEIN